MKIETTPSGPPRFRRQGPESLAREPAHPDWHGLAARLGAVRALHGALCEEHGGSDGAMASAAGSFNAEAASALAAGATGTSDNSFRAINPVVSADGKVASGTPWNIAGEPVSGARGLT